MTWTIIMNKLLCSVLIQWLSGTIEISRAIAYIPILNDY